MTKVYREGAIGALMDEYERAAVDLKDLLRKTDNEDYVTIADSDTPDPDCKSIQTVMTHVIRAGYGYANYIRTHFGDDVPDTNKNFETKTPEDACNEIDLMLEYNIETLQDKWKMSEEEIMKNVFKVRWGPTYDTDHLIEHAIVHILRHRRQIEKFLIKLHPDSNTDNLK